MTASVAKKRNEELIRDMNHLLKLQDAESIDDCFLEDVVRFLVEAKFDESNFITGEVAALLLRNRAPERIRRQLLGYMPDAEDNDWLIHFGLICLSDSELENWRSVVGRAVNSSHFVVRNHARTRLAHLGHLNTTDPEDAEWRRLVVTRKLIESIALWTACQPDLISNKELQELCSELEKREQEMRELLPGPWSTFWETDLRWHEALLAGTGFRYSNDLLRKAFYAIQRQILSDLGQRKREVVLEEHAIIRNSIWNRNYREAVAAFDEHISQSIQMNWEEAGVAAYLKELRAAQSWIVQFLGAKAQ